MWWRYALALTGLFCSVALSGCGGDDCDPCISHNAAGSGDFPPTGLRIESVTPRGLILVWQDNAPSETYHAIERVPVVDGLVDESAWQVVGQQLANLKWFVDETIDGGSTFRYRVSVFDEIGRIGRSDNLDVWVPKVFIYPVGKGRYPLEEVTASTMTHNYRNVFVDGGAQGLQFWDDGNISNVWARALIPFPPQSYQQLMLPSVSTLVFSGLGRDSEYEYVIGRSTERPRYRWNSPTLIRLTGLADAAGVFDSPDGEQVYFFVDNRLCATRFGSPSVQTDRYVEFHAGAGQSHMLAAGDDTLKNYSLEADLSILSAVSASSAGGAEVAIYVSGIQDAGGGKIEYDGYSLFFDGFSDTWTLRRRYRDGRAPLILKTQGRFTVGVGSKFKVKLAISSNRLMVDVNSIRIADIADIRTLDGSPLASGKFAVSAYDGTLKLDHVKVASGGSTVFSDDFDSTGLGWTEVAATSGSAGAPSAARIVGCEVVPGAGKPLALTQVEGYILLSTETGWYVFESKSLDEMPLIASHNWPNPSERVVQLVRESSVAKDVGEPLGVWVRAADGTITYLLPDGFNAFEGRQFDFGWTPSVDDLRTIGVSRNLVTYTSCANGILIFDRNLLAATGDPQVARAGSYGLAAEAASVDCFLSFSIDAWRGIGLANTNELVAFSVLYARSFPAVPE